MIYRSDQIASILKSKSNSNASDPLVISPSPDIDSIKKSLSASIDLRLGTWFMSLRPARMGCLKIQDSNEEPKLTKLHYVPFGKDYFLHPRNFILGTTLEWIRLPQNIAGYVVGKSSWGRRGLIIATATGVHPGFTGCLTLELSNVGEIPIELKPGIHVCQLFLHDIKTSPQKTCDAGLFFGHRRPTLGNIKLDNFAKNLTNHT